MAQWGVVTLPDAPVNLLVCRGVLCNPHGHLLNGEGWLCTGTIKTMAIEVPIVSTLLKVNGVTAETPPSKIRELLRGASYSEADIDEAVLMVSRWGSTPPPVQSAPGPLPGNPIGTSVPYPSPLPLPPLESLTSTDSTKKGLAISKIILITSIVLVVLAVVAVSLYFWFSSLILWAPVKLEAPALTF